MSVYEPAEDTFLLEELLEELELENKKLLEIGTGSGYLAVKAAEKGAKVTATDINPEAIEKAKDKAREKGVIGKIRFLETDLFEDISPKYDYIIFNPPYLPGEYKDETKTWAGGEKGVEITKKFLEEAGDYLGEEGEAYFIGSSLAELEELEEFDINEVDRKKLWFEELIIYRF